MKKLGLLLIAVVLGTTISMAQPGGQRNMDPEESATRQTEQIKEAVSLRSDQEKKVYDVNLEMSKKQTALFSEMQGGNGMEAMREKMTELREEQNTKLKAILTDAQWTAYEKFMEENRGMRGQRPAQ